MISEASRSRNPAGHAGLLENLFALASALAEFFESRFALVAQESKAALVQLMVLAGCLILALILVVFGYGFLVASALAGLAQIVRVSGFWIALGAAVLHFVIALILLLIARNQMSKPLFRATASELKKDREWLKNLEETGQSTS